MSARGDDVATRACGLLSAWTGIELRDSAPSRVDDFLAHRAAQLGYATRHEYLAALRYQPGDSPEPQRLVNLVTNGLTAFWRDPPQLDALRAVLETLEHRTDRPAINIWCAGCATGEEAYTVAMIADELDARVRVVGTDINTEYLEHAAGGVYGDWSLRRLDDERRARYFERTAGGWRLSESLQGEVSFRRHNLLEAAPTPPGGQPWDVVMCRNVLIYFAPTTVARVLEGFGAALDANGYLLLGSSEQLHGPAASPGAPFRAARQGAGFVYRLADTPPGETAGFGEHPLIDRPTPADGSDKVERGGDGGEADAGPANAEVPAALVRAELATAPVPPAIPEGLAEDTQELGDAEFVADFLSSAIDHLRQGHVDAGLACCEAVATYDPFVPANYCVMGELLARGGSPGQAMAAFRKALFLDPFGWVAALRVSDLQARAGHVVLARQACRQVLEGLTRQRQLDAEMGRAAAAIGGPAADPDAAERTAIERLQLLRG